MVAAILLLAAAVRGGTALYAFIGGELYPIGVDSYYHLRLAELIQANFPVRPTFDAYINYPEGSSIPWTLLFDQINLLLAWALSGGRDVMSRLPLAASGMSVIWGVANVVLVYLLSYHLLDNRGAALLSMFFLALLPGHVIWSQFAHLDHHGAEACLSTAFILGLIRSLDGRLPARSRDLWAMGAGTALLVYYQLWVGAAPIIAGAGLYSICLSLWRYRHGANLLPLARANALAFGPAALFLWPINGILPLGQAGSFDYFYPTLFQPAFLTLVGLAAAGVPGLLHLLVRRPTSDVRRILAGLGLLTYLLLLAAFFRSALPGLHYLFKSGDTLFNRSLMTIAEAQPLFFSWTGQRFSAAKAHQHFSFAVWLLPLGWWWAWYHPEKMAPEKRVFLLVWPVVTGALVLTQQRFSVYFSVVCALLYAVLLTGGWDRLRRRGGVPWRVSLLLISITIALLLPTGAWLVRYRQNYFDSIFSPALRDLLGWMRRHTPEPGDFLHPFHPPAYSVLSSRDMSNVILYYAHRPVVGDNFQHGVEPTTRFSTETSEQAYDGLMRRYRVRYLLVGDPVPFLPVALFIAGQDVSGYLQSGRPLPPAYHLCLYRLYHFDGSEVVASRNPKDRLPALRHYRLLVEADPRRTHYSKIFEFVKGGRLTGSGLRPHKGVAAFVSIETNRGRRFVHVVGGMTDASGRFRLEVPYASRDNRWPVHATGPYTLMSEGRSFALAQVRETDVTGGREVEVQPLVTASPPAARIPGGP